MHLSIPSWISILVAWAAVVQGNADVCAIAPGELQYNGKPCGGECCRRKGACVFNSETKVCSSSPGPMDACTINPGFLLPNGRPCRQECCIRRNVEEGGPGCIWDHEAETCTAPRPVDPCVDESDGIPCLGPCCKTRPECVWDRNGRQCLTPMDPCTITPGFVLPNGRPCRQECCMRRNLEEGGLGCIWNHEAETCTAPRPVDPCVDESNGAPCLGPCCKGRTKCAWDRDARQCLTRYSKGTGLCKDAETMKDTFYHTSEEFVTYTECLATCNIDEKCTGFAFEHDFNTCWIYHEMITTGTVELGTWMCYLQD